MRFHSRTKQLPHTHNGRRSAVSTYLKEVIYGGIDGIITTFAVVAGFTGAAFSNETTTQLTFAIALLFGLANLFADAISMGLGNFLAVRSEQSLYKNRRAQEQRESERNVTMEIEETKRTLIQKGFSETDAETLTSIYRKNEPYWLEFIMGDELNMPSPLNENPVYTGFVTFISFIIFGFIPLLPFTVMHSFESQVVFQFSAGGAVAALILLGILKWKVIGTQPIRSVGEIVLVGGTAASIAFLVGSFFTI
jgi:vacuolar iron transporter family protein